MEEIKNIKDIQINSLRKYKRLIPKDKAIKGFLIKNMVDGSSKRVIEDQSVYGENYSMPRLFIKNQYCVSCGIHARIVRVRSTANRRIRYISNFREGVEEASNGLYKQANQRVPPKKNIGKLKLISIFYKFFFSII